MHHVDGPSSCSMLAPRSISCDWALETAGEAAQLRCDQRLGLSAHIDVGGIAVCDALVSDHSFNRPAAKAHCLQHKSGQQDAAAAGRMWTILCLSTHMP